MKRTIVEGMARALFVSSWADREEEEGRAYPGCDLMDVAPTTPQEAIEAAWRLLGRIEQANPGWGAESLYNLACYADAGSNDPDVVQALVDDTERQRIFGHYLAMQAMGHGVSWFDDHATFPIEIPNFEFFI